jgi:hypothetical protein
MIITLILIFKFLLLSNWFRIQIDRWSMFNIIEFIFNKTIALNIKTFLFLLHIIFNFLIYFIFTFIIYWKVIFFQFSFNIIILNSFCTFINWIFQIINLLNWFYFSSIYIYCFFLVLIDFIKYFINFIFIIWIWSVFSILFLF